MIDKNWVQMTMCWWIELHHRKYGKLDTCPRSCQMSNNRWTERIHSYINMYVIFADIHVQLNVLNSVPAAHTTLLMLLLYWWYYTVLKIQWYQQYFEALVLRYYRRTAILWPFTDVIHVHWEMRGDTSCTSLDIMKY